MSFVEPGQFDMIMRLRGRGISDTNVLRAMEQIPRSHFVLQDYVPQAYEERDLPIQCGQVTLAPLTIAMLLQTLEVGLEHKVLHIGTGSGYMAALLARLCKRVYTIERYKTLADLAELPLRKFAANSVVRHGDGRYGWKGQAPFERIVLSVSTRLAPSALLEQLTDGGQMVCVIDEHLCKIKKSKDKISEIKVLPLKLPKIEPGKAQVL